MQMSLSAGIHKQTFISDWFNKFLLSFKVLIKRDGSHFESFSPPATRRRASRQGRLPLSSSVVFPPPSSLFVLFPVSHTQSKSLKEWKWLRGKVVKSPHFWNITHSDNAVIFSLRSTLFGVYSGWGCPGGSQGRAYTIKDQSWSQRRGFNTCLWSFAACPPLDLPYLPGSLTLS